MNTRRNLLILFAVALALLPRLAADDAVAQEQGPAMQTLGFGRPDPRNFGRVPPAEGIRGSLDPWARRILMHSGHWSHKMKLVRKATLCQRLELE